MSDRYLEYGQRRMISELSERVNEVYKKRERNNLSAVWADEMFDEALDGYHLSDAQRRVARTFMNDMLMLKIERDATVQKNMGKIARPMGTLCRTTMLSMGLAAGSLAGLCLDGKEDSLMLIAGSGIASYMVETMYAPLTKFIRQYEYNYELEKFNPQFQRLRERTLEQLLARSL